MKKKVLVLGLILISVVLISIFFINRPTIPEGEPICGNNICELTEDCNNCVEDCGCLENQYCA